MNMSRALHSQHIATSGRGGYSDTGIGGLVIGDGFMSGRGGYLDGIGGLVIGDGFMSGRGGYLDTGIGGLVIGVDAGGFISGRDVGGSSETGRGGYLDGIGGGEHGTSTGTRPNSHRTVAHGRFIMYIVSSSGLGFVVTSPGLVVTSSDQPS